MCDGLGHAEPAIVAQDVWLKFFIRYHRAEVTLRETLIRWFDRPRAGPRSDVRRWRQEFWALRGVSVTAQAGDVIGVIGKNGSGKTTLLKVLGSICAPDRGRIAIRGTVGCLLSFGVGFNANLSGRENIYLNGSILGLSRKMIDERVAQIGEFSELGDFLDAPVKTYSAGMRGRLGFSIAAHIQSDILLLDEALSTGDEGFRAKAGSILDRFRTGRKIVIIASHNMALIRRVCTRALWLDHGSIVSEGDPEEVTRLYEAESKSPEARSGSLPVEPSASPATPSSAAV